MDDVIKQIETVKRALETLNITSSRDNLEVLLGSMQALDRVIFSIQNLRTEKTDETGK